MRRQELARLVAMTAIPPMLIGILIGCFGADAEIRTEIAAISNQVGEQTNAIAAISTTVGNNSGDNWSTRLFLVGLFGVGCVGIILADRRWWHARRKRREAKDGAPVDLCQP